jgi:serine protease AprX
VTAVGENMPIGPNGELRSGTSYSSPLALSIAALMVEANPRLTPDDIEAILTHPQVVRRLPDTDRDGAGFVEPVAAVRMAKAWKTTEPLW